jgi:ribosomal protein L22
MVFGKLELYKETIPESFGDFKFLIEQDGVELCRIPSTIRNDLLMVGLNPLDMFHEISTMLKNAINNAELNGDIEDITEIIISESH